MSDEPAKIILGDTAISAFERTPGKRRFGGGKDAGPTLVHCENCGAELQGHWCSQCGQAAVEYRQKVQAIQAGVQARYQEQLRQATFWQRFRLRRCSPVCSVRILRLGHFSFRPSGLGDAREFCSLFARERSEKGVQIAVAEHFRR